MISEDTQKTIRRLMVKFPCSDSALMPSLCLIQKENGYVSEEDMQGLARLFGLSEARIFSVASFYTMLSMKPRGRYHIQVCTNVSCTILESETLFDYLSGRLGIREGETTPDGLFSIEAVECLGACGYAVAMMINMDHYENLDFEKAFALIESIREKERLK